MCENIDAIQLNFDEEKLFLLNLILAFLMFGISLNLKLADFRRIAETPRKALAGFLSQYIALPAVTFLLVLTLRPCPGIAMGIFLLGACPGGNMSNFLSHLAKGNVALSVTLSVFQTVLAPISTPLIFALCANSYEPTRDLMQAINIDTAKLVREICIILGIPLILGVVVSNKLPGFTAKILQPVQAVSLILFISFLLFSLFNNYRNFIQVIGVIFFIVLLHNALALLCGYTMGAVFKLDFKDKKCLAIETGIINAALGLAIIFTFFKGMGSMAVVAGWWGIWDLIAGGILAAYWNRLDSKKQVKLPA
jgi:BASS family bile acid:Na+ symporter